MDMIIKINLDNAAFEEARDFETRRILDTIKFYDGQKLVDINGNVVGSVEYKEDNKQ